jgi:hypothetical protein
VGAATWAQCRSDFFFDGALVDLLAFDADATAWESLVSALKSGPFKLACFRDGEPIALPESAEWAFAERGKATVMLSILVGPLTANCHFFGGSEIELDIDPREVTSEEAFESVVKLMRFIANSTNLPVVATPEGGGRNCAFLSLGPGGDVVLVPKE